MSNGKNIRLIAFFSMALWVLMLGCGTRPAAAPATPAVSPAPTTAAVPSGTPIPPAAPTAPTPVQPTAPSGSLVDVEPAFRMAAIDLATESEANRPAANTKYAGKVIEVEGTVTTYGGNWVGGQLNGEYAALGDGPTTTKCEFVEKDLWKKIATKSKVKIKGLWKPIAQAIPGGGQCVLENCVFTEVGPSPRRAVTAEQLSSDARDDREQFRARYQLGNELLVTGEVADIKVASTRAVCLVLKTSAPPEVWVILPDNYRQVPGLEATAKTEFPIGTVVTVGGEFNDAMSQNKPEVYLDGPVQKEK